MANLIKGVSREIFLKTDFLNLTDVTIEVIKIPENTTFINENMEEIKPGIYSKIIQIEESGLYYVSIFSLSSNQLKATEKIRVLEYDPVLRINENTEIVRKLETNKAVVSEDGTKATIYEDDGVTILKEFDITDQRVRTPI